MRVSQLMKTYEIADPVPVGLFSTDAVVMLRITVLTCSRRRGLAVLSMTDSSAVFLYSSNGRVKRGGQANTFKYQRQTGNILI